MGGGRWVNCTPTTHHPVPLCFKRNHRTIVRQRVTTGAPLMSDTPFFPEPPPCGRPAPLQPMSEEEASELALRAMQKDEALTRAKQEAYGRVYKRIREKLLNSARRLKAREKSE